MMAHKEILIITGAGVSAPSGIPTFRGINGLYDKKFTWEGQAYEPEEFITKAFYDKHPEAIWEWI
jgi:NAD-dependent deacetylase